MADLNTPLVEDLINRLSKKGNHTKFNKARSSTEINSEAANRLVENIKEENIKEKEKFNKSIKKNINNNK